MFENKDKKEVNFSMKHTLNSIAGSYACINLVNGNIYVGSASLNCMYRRFCGHLLNSKGGSIIVNRAVKKYGVKNFSFLVLEKINNFKEKKEILNIEQKYID